LKEQVDVTKIKGFIDSIDSSVFKKVFDDVIDKQTDDDLKTLNLTKDQLKTSVGGLPDDIKKIFKKHIDSVFNSTEAASNAVATTTDTATEAAAKTEEATIMPPAPPSKAEEAATTTAAATGFKKLHEDEKNETIDQIMKMLKDTGVLEEIKTRICTTAPPAAGGGAKKRRRKTKKNIRRNKNAKTRFGRTF